MGAPLSKAEEFLTAARLAAEQNLWDACAILCYASLYWAAIAALEEQGVKETRWTHDGLKSKFTSELIQRRKRYPEVFGRWLAGGYRLRVTAQYRTERAGIKETRRLLGHVEEFVAKVKEQRQ